MKKDYDILYTNRAQVYVKQERYADAIHDCEWALKVLNPTCVAKQDMDFSLRSHQH